MRVSRCVLTVCSENCLRPLTWSDLVRKAQHRLYFTFTAFFHDCCSLLATLRALHPAAMRALPAAEQDLRGLFAGRDVELWRWWRGLTGRDAYDAVVEPIVLEPAATDVTDVPAASDASDASDASGMTEKEITEKEMAGKEKKGKTSVKRQKEKPKRKEEGVKKAKKRKTVESDDSFDAADDGFEEEELLPEWRG